MAVGSKRQKPIWYVVGCIGLAIVCMPCIGVLAAIAIPAFVNYTRRAKTAEARANVVAIAHGVTAYCAEEHPERVGPFPDAAGPSTQVPGAARQTQDFTAPGWAQVGFAPSEPLYYAYSIERPDAATLHIVAEGDLNSDGDRSRFEIDCTPLVPTACTCTDVVVTNELE